MENQEGKRVMPGSKGRGARIALVVVIVIFAALAAGYIALCALSGSGTLLPNTTVLGVNVGGMPQEQAVQTLEQELDTRLENLSVEFTCDGESYTVPGNNFTVDAAGAIQAAADAQDGSFFTRGAQYLTSLLGGTDSAASVELPQTPDAVTQAVEAYSDPEAQTTWEQTQDSIIFHKGRTGRTLDTAALQADLEAQAAKILAGESPAAPVEAQITTAPPQDPDFQAIYDEIFVAPADAYLDAETKEIVSSVTGVSFDMDAARTALDSTAEGESCTVPLILEQPSLTTEQLSEKLFADVLGTSTTTCAGPSSRWYNIDLAASRVNGTILLPGEEFSYNDLAGPYTVSGGYKKAGAYIGGKNIDTTAGGICQLSSTLYWTTLKANLEIVERNKHKYNSGYMPVVGTDATVYSDTLDFRFKNDTDYPIKIECYQDKSHKLHVTIYGTDTTGIHGEPYSVVLGTVAYQNIYKPDASKVPVGGAPVRDPEYARYNGITVEVYQKLVDKDGNTVDTIFLHKDTYSPSNPVYYYNPADAARLGINTSTGLMTETPVVSPSPSPSATPSPSASPSPSPSNSPSPSPEPSVTSDPSTSPSPSPSPTPPIDLSPSPEPSVTPSPSPSAETGPGMEPVDTPSASIPVESASTAPSPTETSGAVASQPPAA